MNKIVVCISEFCLKKIAFYINPLTTTRVKISRNVDILPKVYLSALKSKTVSNLACSKYIYRSKCVDHFLTGKSIVWYCSGWSK